MLFDLVGVVEGEAEDGEEVDFILHSIQRKEKDISDLKEREPALKLIINLFCGLVFMIFHQLRSLETRHLNK